MRLRDVIIGVILLALFWIFYVLGYAKGEQETIEWYESEEASTCEEGCTA